MTKLFWHDLCFSSSMKPKLLHTLAHDENDSVVSIDDAVKGEIYHCPTCSGDMIVRKSGKTGKGSRRPHYAHKASSNCSPETVLHFLFKTQLHNHLEQCLKQGLSVPIKWDCERCRKTHSRPNLLAKAKAIALEKAVGPYRPDLSLIDELGEPFLAIEVVVTHAPEEAALDYYKSKGIHVVEYHVSSQEDLNRPKRFQQFEKTTVCLQPTCPEHGIAMEDLKLVTAMYSCYKCSAPMKICWIEAHSGSRSGPEDFPQEAINAARNEGVQLKSNYSRTRKERCLSHNCPSCRALQGEFHLSTERGYLTPLKEIPLDSKMCDYCLFDRSGRLTNW